MFIDPLFDREAVKKNVLSVDSEFEMRRTIDGRRISMIQKCLGNRSHDYAKFSCGTQQSLHGGNEGVRQAMIRFFNTFYSANIMSFAFYCNQQLDVMTEMTCSAFRKYKLNTSIGLLN